MPIFHASVQYGDWQGTAAADNADFQATIHELLQKKGLIGETEFLVGIKVWIGEHHGGQVQPPSIEALVFDKLGSYDTVAAALQVTQDPIHFKKIKVELTLDQFLGLFKRFSIVLSSLGLDITGREYTTD